MLAAKFAADFETGRAMQGQPPSEEIQRATLSAFYRDGWVLLPDKLNLEEVECLKRSAQRKLSDPRIFESEDDDQVRRAALMRMFEYSSSFRDLLWREPIVTLVKRILGEDCHVLSQAVIVTPPGQGIVRWHIDDALFFPDGLLNTAAADDTVPCFSLNVMIPLSPVMDLYLGPTEVVPGSHRSGLTNPLSEDVSFRGRAPHSICVDAGEIYLVNSQTWHRGRRNESDQTRYLVTAAYGRRFISQRFYPFLNYRMPKHVLEGVPPEYRELIGLHRKGPYG